jgi:hypothetical protein
MPSSAVTAKCKEIQFAVVIGTNFEAFLYLDLLVKLYMLELVILQDVCHLFLWCCCLMEQAPL